MSAYELNEAINLTAGEDLRGDLFELLKLENDGGVAKVVKTTAATDIAIGVLAENPRTDASTDGENVPVTVLKGRVLVKAAGTITAGQVILPSATAGAVSGAATVAAGSQGVGYALTSAVAGDIFPMFAMTVTGPAA